MIGWIWLAVSLVPLLFSVVAKRKGLDRRFKSMALEEVEEADDGVRTPADIGTLATITLGSRQAVPASGLTQSLEQLAKLHEMGVLNDAQFEQAKTQLLNQPQPPRA